MALHPKKKEKERKKEGTLATSKGYCWRPAFSVYLICSGVSHMLSSEMDLILFLENLCDKQDLGRNIWETELF